MCNERCLRPACKSHSLEFAMRIAKHSYFLLWPTKFLQRMHRTDTRPRWSRIAYQDFVIRCLQCWFGVFDVKLTLCEIRIVIVMATDNLFILISFIIIIIIIPNDNILQIDILFVL